MKMAFWEPKDHFTELTLTFNVTLNISYVKINAQRSTNNSINYS